MQLTPEQKAKLKELADLSKDNVAIVARILEIEDTLDNKFNTAVDAVNTLADIIDKLNTRVNTSLPSGDQRYFTDSELKAIKQDILSQISKPNIDEGKIISTAVSATLTAVKKIIDSQKQSPFDYSKIAEEVSYFLPASQSEQKVIETVREVIDSDIPDKVTSLEEEIKKILKRFDRFETNVQNVIGSTRSGGPGGTNVRVLNNGVPVGDTVSEINFTNATSIEYTGGATGRRANITTGGGSGGSGGGLFAIQTVSGTINGSNTAFTISTAFSGKSFIDLNGQLLVQDTDYTVSGTTVTYTAAPAADLSGATHKLYYGVASNQTEAFQITFDGSGSALTVGTKNRIHIPYACTISKIYMYADQTGSAVLDVWKDTYANYPATIADTIVASAKPTISAATKSTDTTLTGWTTTLSADDHLVVNVDSCSSITWLKLVIVVTRT